MPGLYTQQELEILLSLFCSNAPLSELESKLGRSACGIAGKLKRLSKQDSNTWNPERTNEYKSSYNVIRNLQEGDKRRKYFKAYLEANRERIARQSRAYYEANKERIAKRNKAYYEKNRKRHIERMKAYHAENKAKDKAYYEANRDMIIRRAKARYEANKDRIKEYMRQYRKRKKAEAD